MKERQSNFELMRIMSILFIVLMHVANIIMLDTHSIINKEIIVFINAITNTGVSLFVLLSGYFGVTFKKKRLLDIIFLVLFYSYLSLVVDYFVFHKNIVAKEYISYVFPLLSRKWWFISCYVILYCLSKWINEACSSMSQRSFRNLILVLGFFFYIAPTFLVFYELTDAFGKGIVNMLLLYIIGRYLKLYGFPQFLIEHRKSILVVSILLIFACNSVLTIVGQSVILRFSRDNNILILLETLAIFYSMSKHKFQCKIVNKLASFVLGIYLGQQMFIDIAKLYIPLDANTGNVWTSLGLIFFLAILCCIFTELVRLFISFPIRNIRDKFYSSLPSCNHLV